MPRFKDQAVCVRLHEWSETSQIVSLLTLEHGKVRGLAKGARRTSPSCVARFSGGIELLTGGEVVGTAKPHVELVTITEWDLQRPYRHLRENLAAQRLGLYAADLAGAMLAEHDPHPRAFHALSAFLDELADPSQFGPALLRFQWRLLEDCGYRPRLDRDARTGLPLPDQPAYVFDPRAGGITADTGLAAGRDGEGAGPWRVRRETVEALRAVASGAGAAPALVQDAKGSGVVSPNAHPAHGWRLRGETTPDPLLLADERSLRRANRLLCVYARAILDRELPTMALLLE